MTILIFVILLLPFFHQITSRDIWTVEKAQAWFQTFPYLQGSQYIVSDAGNQLEMFQNDTWNPTLIDKEFGLAEALGSNTLRIFLHDLAYEADSIGFKSRLNTLLDLAAKHGIKPLLALFDECGVHDPAIGQQGQPNPGQMMSQWVRSPGHHAMDDPSQQPRLEAYVKDLCGTFANDTRILGWDLFNEPPCGGRGLNPNLLDLLTNVFVWCRSVDPIQPLTAPLSGNDIDYGNISRYLNNSRIILDNSDVITFHQYLDAGGFNFRLQAIKKVVGGRPIIATEYMARMDQKSTVENNLPVAKANNVGMLNWGFIQGRIQNNYPWESARHPYKTWQPWLWFHDFFRNDYSPYLIEELQTVKRFNDCPKGYKSTIGGSRNFTCYNAYSTQLAYADAQAACKNTWATLATIESVSQNSDILGYPTNDASSTCVVLNKDGTWTNQACTIPQCYLCSY